MVQLKAPRDSGICTRSLPGNVRSVPSRKEDASRATARAIRAYAEAADDGLGESLDPRTRSTASLTAAAFLFAAAIAEASVFLNASAIDSAVIDGVEHACLGLARGASEILEDDNLAERFTALNRVIASGMSAIVTECVLLTEPTEESTMVH